MYRKLICLVFSILMLGMASSVYADLVGHWMLDDGSGTTASDSSGNGNDGTITNNPDFDDPTWIAGPNGGGAMEFYGDTSVYGSANHIDCGNDASLDITGPISIALWIRPDADDPEGKGSPDGETAPMAKAMSGMSPDWSWQVRALSLICRLRSIRRPGPGPTLAGTWSATSGAISHARMTAPR